MTSSLMKTRDHRVTVIRSNASSLIGSDGNVARYSLVLPERQNDVLAALTQSGGLPSFNERNEVIIDKASRIPVEQRHDLLQQLVSGCGPCGTPNPIYDLPQFAHMGEPIPDSITLDLQLAKNNSTENILVQPGDTLILRFKPEEELVNFGIGTFFTFGIRELFSN